MIKWLCVQHEYEIKRAWVEGVAIDTKRPTSHL